MEITTVSYQRMDGFIQRNHDWVEKARQVMRIKKNIEELAMIEKELTEELKSLSQGVNSFGGGFKYSQSFRKGSVDYKTVPQLQGVNLDQYRGQAVEIWKLSLEME